MHVVRLGATRVRGLGSKYYDEQFRLKLSMDPTKPLEIWIRKFGCYTYMTVQLKWFNQIIRLSGGRQSLSVLTIITRVFVNAQHAFIRIHVLNARMLIRPCPALVKIAHKHCPLVPEGQSVFKVPDRKSITDQEQEHISTHASQDKESQDLWALGKTPVNTKRLLVCLKNYPLRDVAQEF